MIPFCRRKNKMKQLLILLVALFCLSSTVFAQQANFTAVYPTSGCTDLPLFASVVESCASTTCTQVGNTYTNCFTRAIPSRTAVDLFPGQYFALYAFTDSNCAEVAPTSASSSPFAITRNDNCFLLGNKAWKIARINDTAALLTDYIGSDCMSRGFIEQEVVFNQCNPTMLQVSLIPVYVNRTVTLSPKPGVSPRISPRRTPGPGPVPGPGGNASALFLSTLALIFAIFTL